MKLSEAGNTVKFSESRYIKHKLTGFFNSLGLFDAGKEARRMLLMVHIIISSKSIAISETAHKHTYQSGLPAAR
jgi:hypothetical protein